MTSEDVDVVEARLIDAIAAEPDAIAPRLIYADWLQSRDDLRGELIIVQHELARDPDDLGLRARAAELAAHLTAELLPPDLPTEVIGRWRLGFVDRLSLTRRNVIALTRHHADWFERPALRLVRELALTSSGNANLRDVLATRAGRTMRRLELGSLHNALTRNFSMIARLPLDHLVLRSSVSPELAGLERLRLTSFGIEVGNLLPPAMLDRIFEYEWPLTELVIRANANPDIIESMTRLLEGAAFPDLRHLTLLGWLPTVELVEAIATSELGRRLDSLTVNWNRIAGDEDVARIRRHRDALRRIELRAPGDDPAASGHLGILLHYHLDRIAEAIPWYRAAPSTNNKHCMAIALRKVGRLDESLAIYDAIIAREGDAASANLHNDRHFTLCDLGRHAEAVAALERAVAKNPRYASAWNNLGYERERAGDKDAAFDAYRRALDLDPDNDYARRNLSKLLQSLGRADEALAMHDAIIERLGEATPARVWNGRHFVLCKLARYGDALASLERAIVVDSNDDAVWNNVGYERQRAGNIPGAIAAYQRALDIVPAQEYAGRNLVELYLDLDRTADALAMGERQRAARPTDRKLAGAYGEALIRTGRAAEAVAAMSALLDDPALDARERPLVVRAVARRAADGDQLGARRDLETVVRTTDCPAWVALAWLAIAIVDPATWRTAVPHSVVSADDICKRIVAGASAARGADPAVALHDASIEDRLYCSEIAIVAALLDGEHAVALARARGLVDELEARRGFVVDPWHVESMVFRLALDRLAAADRELATLVIAVTRGRRPRGDLAARL